MPKQGVLEYEIDYYAAEHKINKTFRKMEYTINTTAPFDIEWLDLEEKDGD